MSRTPDGRRLRCDGPGCDACAPVPVILRTVRTSGEIPPRWLFVQEGNIWKHYCPSCARRIFLTEALAEKGEEAAL